MVYEINSTLLRSNYFSRYGLYFRPDYNLPKKCRAYSNNYSYTGFDRGHNAPNAAFAYNRSIQKQTFLLSNIAPQKPQLNRKLWAKIERFARYEAYRYGYVRVITGNCGSLGHIKNDVNIPAYWYKIIFLPNGKIISFLAKNTNMVGKDKMKQHLSNIEEIERVCKFKIKEKK